MTRLRNELSAGIIAAGIIFLFATAASLNAQGLTKRSIDVTVTEPLGRTVAGLQKDHFGVMEGGAERTITAFSEVRHEDPQKGAHYRVEFESVVADSPVQVVLKPPRGLPSLTITWK